MPSFDIKWGGLNTKGDLSAVYPDALVAQNVRFGTSGEVIKRNGFTTYNATAMITTKEVVTGIFQFDRRDGTTQYTIVGTGTRILLCPTSGAWTVLASGLTGGTTAYWDAAVFNNKLILVNGVDAPQITDGTAAGTGGLVSRSWQARTSSGTAQGVSCGMNVIAGTGEAYNLCGYSSGTSVGSQNQSYDPYVDTWKNLTHASILRYAGQSASVGAHGRIYVPSGGTSGPGGSPGPSVTETSESYDVVGDTWSAMTSIPTGVEFAGCWGINGSVYVAGGTTTTSATNAVANNVQYDPTVDGWTTRTSLATARSEAGYFIISESGYVMCGESTVPANIAGGESYNPFTDALNTAPANPTAAGIQPVGSEGFGDGLGYLIGGDTSGSAIALTQSYSRITNAWTTENSLITARFGAASAISDYWIYCHGNNTPTTSLERFNAGPAAPVAYYVKTYKSYLFLARTSSFPSRVYYSTVGDANQWPSFNFMDINPDDGDWITGMFVYVNQLYVFKNQKTYWIQGSVFDPGPNGDQSVLTLQQIPGCISNRSIVVTDQGVFYLSQDGFRVFNGFRSDLISRDISNTINGFVQSRDKYVQGIWKKNTYEVWWTVTASGSTMNQIMVYNYLLKRWSLHVGMNAESLATVDDANKNDQVLFGTADTTDGKIYKADTGNNDNSAAIDAIYQTGWFSPTGKDDGGADIGPLYANIQRDGNWAITLTSYVNYSSTAVQTDTINLLSGGPYLNQQATKDKYFYDGVGHKCRVPLGTAASTSGQALQGHRFSFKIENNASGQTFTLESGAKLMFNETNGDR